MNGCWEFKMQPWDIAASALIATEAGALVTKMDGDLNIIDPPFSIVAANPGLHAEMLKVINEVLSRPENKAYQEYLAG